MKKIAVVPVYNEESTLPAVLDSLVSQLDLLVIVDDGSTDGSLQVARRRAARENRLRVLQLRENRGMSAALREGFLYLVALHRAGELDSRDLVFTIDADGQHDARQIDALAVHVRERNLDVALTCRDFSLYPAHKRWGNRLMTLWGSLWSGFRYRDIESGFRALRLRVLPAMMDYYTGYRYSCAQEIAVLTARLGFRVDNEFRTVIQLYRSQTGLRDVIINAALGAWASVRWTFRRPLAARPAAARLASPAEDVP
ncbi:MAG: glycosyltransferase family 2 protein [Acidobacteria bacterium]|nr:glycosyltransferase family 2 protein [Acidobacteriota bacterium]